MRYIAGEKLDDYIRRKGRLSEREGLNLIESIGTVLAAVHKRNVLHRDIKPNNIIITHEGKAFLIDFGIAREVDSLNTQIFYTPQYSPPEQRIAHAPMGAYSDIYSLGALAYYIFTGVPPLSLEEHTIGNSKSLKEMAPDLSNTIVSAITRSLHFKPEQRFNRVEAFLEALKAPKIIESVNTKQPSKESAPSQATIIEDKNKVNSEDKNKTKVYEASEKTIVESKPNSFKQYWLIAAVITAFILLFVLFKTQAPKVVKPVEKTDTIKVPTTPVPPPVIPVPPEPVPPPVRSGYRASYELAKSTTGTKRDQHHLAFQQLRKAAKIAIATHEADSLLNDIGNDLKNRNENSLWKLSSGHQKDWEPIIKALNDKDIKLLEGHHH